MLFHLAQFVHNVNSQSCHLSGKLIKTQRMQDENPVIQKDPLSKTKQTHKPVRNNANKHKARRPEIIPNKTNDQERRTRKHEKDGQKYKKKEFKKKNLQPFQHKIMKLQDMNIDRAVSHFFKNLIHLNKNEEVLYCTINSDHR